MISAARRPARRGAARPIGRRGSAAVAVVCAATLIGTAGARVHRPTIELTATDPGYSYAIQVGDTITLLAVVHDPNARAPSGTVSFATNDAYDTGCRAVRLDHSTHATCYVTYYSPGSYRVKATYKGEDRVTATVTLRLKVVPSSDD